MFFLKPYHFCVLNLGGPLLTQPISPKWCQETFQTRSWSTIHFFLVLLELNCHIMRKSKPSDTERLYGEATWGLQLRSQYNHRNEAASSWFQPPATKSSPVFWFSQMRSQQKQVTLPCSNSRPQNPWVWQSGCISPPSFWGCCYSAIVTEISLCQAHEPNPFSKHVWVTDWLWPHVLAFRLKLILSFALSPTSSGEEHGPWSEPLSWISGAPYPLEITMTMNVTQITSPLTSKHMARMV